MAKFKYVVKDKEGKTLKGSIESPVKASAIQSLRSRGLTIVILEEEKGFAFSLDMLGVFKKKKINIDELVIFSRQLATMISSGIPLVTALDILTEQIQNVPFKKIVSRVRDDVEIGSSLSEAMAKHKDTFSGLFVNMVRAGESSGMLDEILERVTVYLEKTSALQKKVKAALMYPTIVTLMALTITSFLMIKVVPVFSEIYSGFGADLPMPTQVMINISGVMRRYFYIAICLVIAAAFLLRRYIRSSRGKIRFDSLKINVPIFGILMRKIAVGKFTRTLSTLVRSGVPILSSLEIVSKTADNCIIEMAVNKVRENVKEGESIAEPLAKSGVFPPMVVRMISVGEQTGELEKMLGKIADFYDEQVETAVSGLTSLIEPLIIAFLGIVIGSIVIAMFLPILKISEIIAM